MFNDQAHRLQSAVEKNAVGYFFALILLFAGLIVFFSLKINPTPCLMQLNIEGASEPTLENPVSQMATEKQFHSQAYAFWCSELKEAVRTHRKQWEFCYILQTLKNFNMLQEGKRGLGFGVGKEPLAALFAKYGCQVTATDLDFSSAAKKGWVHTAQHIAKKKDLNEKGICPAEKFESLVEYREVDMNAIPADLKGYDFVWSACSLEHLGNLQKGMDFIKNSLQCLKPGGVAVHTTEFNLSSNDQTLSSGSTVIYRKMDFERLASKLRAEGYTVLPLNFNMGDSYLDTHYDVPPYNHAVNHIKLQLKKYICTSFGIVVIKPTEL